jgi:hypothetical protein
MTRPHPIGPSSLNPLRYLLSMHAPKSFTQFTISFRICKSQLDKCPWRTITPTAFHPYLQPCHERLANIIE